MVGGDLASLILNLETSVHKPSASQLGNFTAGERVLAPGK